MSSLVAIALTSCTFAGAAPRPATVYSANAGSLKEMESINRLASQIENLQPDINTWEKMASAVKAMKKAFNQNSALSEVVKSMEAQLRSIRNIAAHNSAPIIATKPAYSLDNIDDE